MYKDKNDEKYWFGLDNGRDGVNIPGLNCAVVMGDIASINEITGINKDHYNFKGLLEVKANGMLAEQSQIKMDYTAEECLWV